MARRSPRRCLRQFPPALDQGDERIKITIRDVEACDVLDPHQVRYRFKGGRTRDLPLTLAGLPIFSKAYYAKVDFTKSTLDPPLGSGPYKVKSFKPGEYVTYERRDDYWAKDLPVNRGRYNFDEVRFEYFRDRTAALEALKSGVIDLREEYTSRDWATAYDFPAVEDGRVKQLGLAGRDAIGRPRFLLQSAPGEIPGHPRAQGAEPRLRFRMVEPESVLWPL